MDWHPDGLPDAPRSRRWILLLPVIALVGVGALVAAAPALVPGVAAGAGVSVETAAWCGDGLCLAGVTRGGARVERAVIGWNRVAHLQGVAVPLSDVLAMAGGAGAPAGMGSGGASAADAADLGLAADPGAASRIDGSDAPRGAGVEPASPEEAGPPSAAALAVARSLLVAVDVTDLQIPGAPLPVLSGRVWPERRLRGEGFAVEGDTLRMDVPTPFGTVALEAARGAAGIDLDATCAGCVLPAPGDADTPLPLGDVRLRGVWADGLFRGAVTARDVTADLVITREEGCLTAEVSLRSTPMVDVYGVFSPWVPELRRARIDGTAAGSARARWSEAAGLEVLAFSPEVSDFTVEGLVPDALAGGRFQVRGRGADGEERLFEFGEGTSAWVPLPELGPWLPAAVIAAEDAGFRAHLGYDLAGMQGAAAANAAEGDIVRGGSTLTQQLAKNLFLDGTRSYARKLRELLYAVEMERELGKQRILALYLNVVEFGPGLRGARAAADTYFLKAPAGLLPEEAAWLASILRFPKTAYKRQYLANTVDASRVRWILQNMRGVPEDARAAALGREVHLVPAGR